ncbi:MAG: glycosyltransferase family 2 protein [Ferruginibacter sp.]|nr:glycosyltransferase family 2 protein [Ferruginibacter sp.]
MITDVIIPAYNEEDAIAKVVQALPLHLLREIVVVNNNSRDATTAHAIAAGATVLQEPRQGYGYACLKGIEYLCAKSTPPGIVLFIDADFSDYPEEAFEILDPIINGTADLVIGSRALGNKEKGSMTIPQVFGTWLATTLLRYIYKVKFSDLGPFRAVKFDKLLALKMQDTTYGWTVEMQLKAAKQKLKCIEVPVKYRKRVGVSKISGTIKGTVLAGYKILYTIFKYM